MIELIKITKFSPLMGKKHSVTSEGHQIWHQRDSMKRLVLIPRLSDIFRMTEKKNTVEQE
jgi:hypothetical protein